MSLRVGNNTIVIAGRRSVSRLNAFEIFMVVGRINEQILNGQVSVIYIHHFRLSISYPAAKITALRGLTIFCGDRRMPML